MRRPGPKENYGRELLELHTVGIDGGYVKASDAPSRQEGWFEVMVGKSLPRAGSGQVFAFVHRLEPKPNERMEYRRHFFEKFWKIRLVKIPTALVVNSCRHRESRNIILANRPTLDEKIEHRPENR